MAPFCRDSQFPVWPAPQRSAVLENMLWFEWTWRGFSCLRNLNPSSPGETKLFSFNIPLPVATPSGLRVGPWHGDRQLYLWWTRANRRLWPHNRVCHLDLLGWSAGRGQRAALGEDAGPWVHLWHMPSCGVQSSEYVRRTPASVLVWRKFKVQPMCLQPMKPHRKKCSSEPWAAVFCSPEIPFLSSSTALPET